MRTGQFETRMIEPARDSRDEIHLPDDSGRRSRRVELPDDSGRRSRRVELPDDSGRRLRQTELPDDSGRRSRDAQDAQDAQDVPEKAPQMRIDFVCPDNLDKKEFKRQIKAQERGINSQTVAENMRNRKLYQERRELTGSGRALEGAEAQNRIRQKALASRIHDNQSKGMSYSEAKAEAENWLSNQAALHNPDQIAGGDPKKVSRLGDAAVNSSIGSQWRSRAAALEKYTDDLAQIYTPEQRSKVKMNVKLEVT